METISISDLLVLLVEPSTTQQRVIHNYFSELGVDSLDVVTSGDEALTAMQKTPPDLVVSAMHLPDITGTQLVEKMREDEALADIPFMLISSETDVRYLEPIRQAGAIAILPKPFEASHLREALIATIDLLDPDSLGLEECQPDIMDVLIVDDSSLSRKHIRRVLENMGLERFTEVENGREAIEIMQECEFDLIVTDYNMPEVDGKDFIRYVRNESRQPGVPILMVTSENDTNRLAQVEQEGVSAICDKPFEPRNVQNLLQKIL